MGSPDEFHILLVEDNPGDQRLVMEALKSGTGRSRLHLVADGSLAMEFLFRRGKYCSSPFPHLILLDLNMPTDGSSVLKRIKQDPTLAKIPTVILTTSKSEREKAHVLNLGANGFFTKPPLAEDFFALIREIENYWTVLSKAA